MLQRKLEFCPSAVPVQINLTENPPQMLSEEATFSHSSGRKAGCVYKYKQLLRHFNQRHLFQIPGFKGRLDESSSDIAYCHMENIDLHEKVQIQENCVNVEDSVLRAISRRARKQRSYKKQIQDAFTSKKRLVKEYEQLAIWFGDVGLDSSQEANSYKVNSGTHQAGDSEWELL